MNRIIEYLNYIFAKMPNTPEVIKAKNELAQMMEDKFNELLEEGIEEEEAFKTVVNEFGNVEEIAEELGLSMEQAKDIQNQMNNRNQYGASQFQYKSYEFNQPQKKSHTWVVILSVILAIMLLAGIVVAICVAIFQVSTSYTRGIKEGIDWLVDGDEDYTSVDADIDVEEFHAIDVDSKIADLEMEEGDRFHVFYSYPENYEPSVEVKDGVLTVKDGFTVGPRINFGKKIKCKLIITVPSETEIKSTDLKLNMGNVEINDFSFGDTTIDTDMGNIELKGCDFGTLYVKADMGYIEFDDCQFTSGELKADMGAISLSDTDFDEATADASMGAIEISGNFNSLQADCSMGAIEVECKNPDAKMDLEADMGTIEVNGKIQGKSYKK